MDDWEELRRHRRILSVHGHRRRTSVWREGTAHSGRLNGAIVQDATTNDMVFRVAQLISIVSESITLSPGDIIVTGTPAGVGMARNPPLFMKHGDVCEVEIEGIGTLRNVVRDE